MISWRTRSYPVEVYARDKIIWKGYTPKCFGYIHFSPDSVIITDRFTIRQIDVAVDKDAFAIKELGGDPANEMDSKQSKEYQLGIEEAEFLEKMLTKTQIFMENTWRWFGPNDKITLPMLKQIGVEGIVTALHHIPNGEIWTLEEVNKMKGFIEQHGMRWSVVESLPVSESIKYGGSDRDELIEKYKISLANLGKAGVKTICYNFMPVLDWARTDLDSPNPDGTTNLYFNLAEFAYFDINILKRTDAEKDYDEKTLRRMHDEIAPHMDEEAEKRLVDNIIVKTQGFVNGNISENDPDPVEKFRSLLALYKGIDAEKLRENMAYFLNAIMPVCEKYDINMCVHPDDPPMAILGLPRIVTCDSDIQAFLDAVPNPHNGLTFCAGSLSAGAHNDVPSLAKKYADRTHFVHARICNVLPNGDFKEATHLDPRLIDVVRTFETLRPELPMRVDHAPLMLGDEKLGYNAGYSFHGRMLALGMVRGIMATVNSEK